METLDWDEIPCWYDEEVFFGDDHEGDLEQSVTARVMQEWDNDENFNRFRD